MEIDLSKYYWLYDVIKPVINGYVVVNFFLGNLYIYFSFNFISIHYHPKNKRKKLPEIKN